MTSQINPNYPVAGNPTTASVRANFATAQVEISALQVAAQGAPFLPVAGGTMQGVLTLHNDPTGPMQPVTLGYFQANGGGGGSGSGGIPDAPADGTLYGRQDGAWLHAVDAAELDAAVSGAPFVPIAGGTMQGILTLFGPPVNALDAATKGYADTNFVALAGATMTGLLVLSGPPTQSLGAATKGYIDGQNFIPQLGPSGIGVSVIDLTTTSDRTPTIAGLVTPYNPSSDGLVLAAKRLATPVLVGSYSFNVDGPNIRLFGPSVPSVANGIQIETGNNAAGFKAWSLNSNGNSVFPGSIALAITMPSPPPGNVGGQGGQIIGMGVSVYNCAINAYFDGSQWRYLSSANNAAYVLGAGTGNAGMNVSMAPPGTAGASPSWLSAMTLDISGNLGCAGRFTSGSGRIVSQNASQNPSVCCYDTQLGCMGILLGGGPRLYFATFDGYGNFTSTFGSFDGVGNFTASGSILANSYISTPTYIRHTNVDNGYGYSWRWDGTNFWCPLNANMGSLLNIQLGSASDRRFKTGIAPVTVDPLAVINQIALHRFDLQPPMHDRATHQSVGVMADELAELIPEAVNLGDGKYTYDLLNLMPLVGYLIGAMQQLTERVVALETTATRH